MYRFVKHDIKYEYCYRVESSSYAKIVLHPIRDKRWWIDGCDRTNRARWSSPLFFVRLHAMRAACNERAPTRESVWQREACGKDEHSNGRKATGHSRNRRLLFACSEYIVEHLPSGNLQILRLAYVQQEQFALPYLRMSPFFIPTRCLRSLCNMYVQLFAVR